MGYNAHRLSFIFRIGNYSRQGALGRSHYKCHLSQVRRFEEKWVLMHPLNFARDDHGQT